MKKGRGTLNKRKLSKKANSNEQNQTNTDIIAIYIFSIFDACVFAELKTG
jgi:hypothetical protein